MQGERLVKKLFVGLLVSLPFICGAEPVALNFNAIPLVQFAQSTYKIMMKRDFVLSSELLAMEKPISVSVRNISSEVLPKFVERILSSQGVSSVERDGIYYLSVASAEVGGRSGATPIQLSGQIRSGQGSFGESGSVGAVERDDYSSNSNSRSGDQGLDDERNIYEPLNRKADFIALVLNAVFSSKPAVVSGGAVVISASKDRLQKVLTVAKGIDTAPHKVKVSATFVEVSTNASSGVGVSVIADLLGVKLGIKLGDTSSGSLTLKGNSFQAVLDAITSDGRFRQVSNPTALVDDYEKTNVSFGDSVPTVSSTTLDKNGNPIQQIVYQQSGVLLDVTPRVLSSGRINLTVDGQVSSFSATTTGVTSSPTLSKRQVQTALTMDDGEILIIGGLNNNKTVNNESGFSFLPKSWSLKNENSANTDLVLILSASVVK